MGSTKLGMFGSSASRNSSMDRRFSRTSRRSSSFLSIHRSKMSSELTSTAEAKFFALMDLMSSASREASSLKDIWAKLLAERESWVIEREEMMEQMTEVSQELERTRVELGKHLPDSEDRKKHTEKLKLDLSLSVAAVLAEKKKVVDRDHQLTVVRREFQETKDIITRSHAELERVRTEYDATVILLRTAEGDRDNARDDADRVRREVSKVTRERTEISSRLTDFTAKYESSHREVLSLTDRLKMLEMEGDEHLHEVDRLKEEIRKTKLRAEESIKELLEMTERSASLSRELGKLKESGRAIEIERDDLAHTVEHLRRDNKTAMTNLSESEDRISEVSLKYEHIKRELLSTKDKLRELELERKDTLEVIERSREQYRLIVIERDELKDAVSISERKTHDGSRRILALEESIRRGESLLAEARAESVTLSERITHISLERDEARSLHGQLQAELTEVKASIVMFHAEIRAMTESRDLLRRELDKSRFEFEELTESITSYEEGSQQLEFEVESLRTLLSEAREQKERAIAARNLADRERDESTAKYEEKCRELERYEESAASAYHAQASSSQGEKRTTSTRVVSSRSTAAATHNGAHQSN